MKYSRYYEWYLPGIRLNGTVEYSLQARDRGYPIRTSDAFEPFFSGVRDRLGRIWFKARESLTRVLVNLFLPGNGCNKNPVTVNRAMREIQGIVVTLPGASPGFWEPGEKVIFEKAYPRVRVSLFPADCGGNFVFNVRT
jgi:hypothetical protein